MVKRTEKVKTVALSNTKLRAKKPNNLKLVKGKKVPQKTPMKVKPDPLLVSTPDSDRILRDLETENIKNHYVNNKEFLAAIIIYRKDCKAAGKQVRVTDYIGECLYKIAARLSHKPCFANYQYREDMVQDGVENSLRYIMSFNPEISQNPFSYFTQITYNAFLRKIKTEKKELYIKCVSVQNTRQEGVQHENMISIVERGDWDRKIDEFVSDYETSLQNKKLKKAAPVVPGKRRMNIFKKK